MACITSTSYSVCVNGDLHGFFKGKRGLRQGDLIVASVELIRKSLDDFKRCSGLSASLPKSTAFFSNVRSNVKTTILANLQFEEGSLPVRYLGIPLVSSRLLYLDCKLLVDRVRNKINDWKNKFLSFAERVQLIVSVHTAMLLYWCSVFILSDGIVKEIEKIIRGFLWCQGELKRGKAKVLWNDVCLPKDEGGLGIKSLKLWNSALMSSHLWRLMTCKQSLWVQWTHTYKLANHNLWDVPISANASWSWRKMLQIRPLVHPFFFYQIGNGRNASAWFDSCGPHGPLINIISTHDIMQVGFSMKATVNDICVSSATSWFQDWKQRYPALHSVMLPSLNNNNDKLLWKDIDDNNHNWAVSHVWDSIRPQATCVPWFSVVWFSHCIPKHAFIMCDSHIKRCVRLHMASSEWKNCRDALIPFARRILLGWL
ncbi:uncharacterized protein [Rutidosis leptorrhynchoides]|uniref:uncharacterized protein n=1 Tax=Rutidosis leptorrhynchoides TaxID=125765 RepID=UPI003A99C4A8